VDLTCATFDRLANTPVMAAGKLTSLRRRKKFGFIKLVLSLGLKGHVEAIFILFN
jgi:hypothetical protein